MYKQTPCIQFHYKSKCIIGVTSFVHSPSSSAKQKVAVFPNSHTLSFLLNTTHFKLSGAVTERKEKLIYAFPKGTSTKCP